MYVYNKTQLQRMLHHFLALSLNFDTNVECMGVLCKYSLSNVSTISYPNAINSQIKHILQCMCTQAHIHYGYIVDILRVNYIWCIAHENTQTLIPGNLVASVARRLFSESVQNRKTWARAAVQCDASYQLNSFQSCVLPKLRIKSDELMRCGLVTSGCSL